MKVRVESELDEYGTPAPRRLSFGARRVGVAERLDRWDGDTYRYYKLRGDDGALYILLFDEWARSWRLVMFESDDAERRRSPERTVFLN